MNRKEIIRKHNPSHRCIDYLSPFTVGNGSIAYTADITGMQTLYEEQQNAGFPLLTMASWGWHTTPAEVADNYDLERDLVMARYPHGRGFVTYPTMKMPGNEAVYDWLRENPHRYNLLRLGLRYQNRAIPPDGLLDARQYLDLYSGILYSSFFLDGERVTVTTACHQEKDVLAFEIHSDLLCQGRLQAALYFPYASPDITGSDWNAQDRHQTRILSENSQACLIGHFLDHASCLAEVCHEGPAPIQFIPSGAHVILCQPPEANTFSFTVGLAGQKDRLPRASFLECMQSSRIKWKDFWENGAFISFAGSTDPRADELERRIILSLYVSAVNSCCNMPPQETGLTVNSWNGKAHLEMYLWHVAYLALWHRGSLLKKSLGWFKAILPAAVQNARRNHYAGARWPKMVGPDGKDCPSPVGPLLIWQQPHLIYILELLYQADRSEALLAEYWESIRQTADFMADFAEYNEKEGVYELTAPLIPAQEVYSPEDTKNPTFETEYWVFGLKLAIRWAKRLHQDYPAIWERVANHMAAPKTINGLYPGHGQCKTSYTEYAKDHPSVAAAMGLLPGDRIDPAAMRRTLDTIYQSWDFSEMWGWDFAMMAMAETRTGGSGRALDILMYDTPKNQYLPNGHNRQADRGDLPLYLPGNGALLLAIPLMAMGYPGCGVPHPGFPPDGSWNIETENMGAFPF